MLRVRCSVLFAAMSMVVFGCGDHRGAAVTSSVASAKPAVVSLPPLPPVTEVPKSRRIGHVFLVVLENEGVKKAFGAASRAPYLAQVLPSQGALLNNYYGIGHNSLPNYVALISGQGPNPVTQQDCVMFEEFVGKAPDPALDGQAVGKGCVYPTSVRTLPDQLEAARPSPFTWKGYMEDMGKDPKRESATCGHPAINGRDGTQEATAKDQYAVRHNPFVYFHGLIDDESRCNEHVVNLDRFREDLASESTTPNFSMIVPNLCNDGHDAGCANGDTGGLESIDPFLRIWVPQILASPAYRDDGLLVINFDEAETAYADSTACGGITATPNTDQPGIIGPGGGVTGALVLSPFVQGGTVSNELYNHYSLLKTVEAIFGLPYLGYAAHSGSTVFGKDVFTKAMPELPSRP